MPDSARSSDRISDVIDNNIDAIMGAEKQRSSATAERYRTVSRIASFCGTISFMVVNALVLAVWILWNSTTYAFDPYPFTALALLLSIEAICLSLLILISQNMAAAESERRSHLDLQINLLGEREMTALLRLVLQIASAQGISAEAQEEVREFANATDPTRVFRQIVAAEERHHTEAATSHQ